MPLNKIEGLDLTHASYEVKVAMVLHNCQGCSYFRLMDLEDDIFPVYGCTYPTDIQDLNPYLRAPYLTIVEIAVNTCMFWRGRMMEPVPPPDSTPDEDWSAIPPNDYQSSTSG